MQNDYWGFRESPFSLSPDPAFLYRSRQHDEALANLIYGVQSRKGFTVLTGQPGTGKTLLLECLRDFLRNQYIGFVTLDHSRVTTNQFFEMIAYGMELPWKSKTEVLFGLNQVLRGQARAGLTTALIVDEAQNLDWEVLEEIRLLGNLEDRRGKLLQIVLAGQPEFDRKLDQPDLRQLKQRVLLRCSIQPFNEAETRDYIAYRLERAGMPNQKVFAPDLLNEIHACAEGVPRLINAICDNLLLMTYAASGKSATKEMLAEVREELRLFDPRFQTPVVFENAPRLRTPEIYPLSTFQPITGPEDLASYDELAIPASPPEQPPASHAPSYTDGDTDGQLAPPVFADMAPSRNGGRHVVWFKWKSSLIASGLVAAALLSAIGWLRSGLNSPGEHVQTGATRVAKGTKVQPNSETPVASAVPAPVFPAPQQPEPSDFITSPQPLLASAPVQKNTVSQNASPNLPAVNISPNAVNISPNKVNISPNVSQAEPAQPQPDRSPQAPPKQPDVVTPPSAAPEVAQRPAPVSRPNETPATPNRVATGQTATAALLSRVAGSWTYSSNGIYKGSEPEIAEMAVRNDNGYIIGTLAVRFKSVSKGGSEPLLRFAFGGDLHNAARPTFNLESKDGGKGTIELIPGAAPNRLEVNFQAGQEPGRVLSADMMLDKRAGPPDRESAGKNQMASSAPPVQPPQETQRASTAALLTPPLTPSRLTGAWSYPAVRTDGVEPELFEMAIRNDNGYMIGTLSVRFKSPSREASEPLLHFAFSGELPTTARPIFKLDSREGGHGSIELIPGTAPNLLEIKFQTEEADRNHSGNIVLVKRAISTVANAAPRP